MGGWSLPKRPRTFLPSWLRSLLCRDGRILYDPHICWGFLLILFDSANECLAHGSMIVRTYVAFKMESCGQKQILTLTFDEAHFFLLLLFVR